MLHSLLLVLSSCVGSPFLRFADVVAGAVMLRMWRCGLAVFVALVWRACCWWVTHVHACGGSCIAVRLVLLGVASLVRSLCSSPLLLSLSVSLSLSQWKANQLDSTDLGRTSRVYGHCFDGVAFLRGISGLYAVGCCLGHLVLVIP